MIGNSLSPYIGKLVTPFVALALRCRDRGYKKHLLKRNNIRDALEEQLEEEEAEAAAARYERRPTGRPAGEAEDEGEQEAEEAEGGSEE